MITLKLDTREKTEKVKRFVNELKQKPEIVPFLHIEDLPRLGIFDFCYVNARTISFAIIDERIMMHHYVYLAQFAADLRLLFTSVSDYVFHDEHLQHVCESFITMVNQFQASFISHYTANEALSGSIKGRSIEGKKETLGRKEASIKNSIQEKKAAQTKKQKQSKKEKKEKSLQIKNQVQNNRSVENRLNTNEQKSSEGKSPPKEDLPNQNNPPMRIEENENVQQAEVQSIWEPNPQDNRSEMAEKLEMLYFLQKYEGNETYLKLLSSYFGIGYESNGEFIININPQSAFWKIYCPDND